MRRWFIRLLVAALGAQLLGVAMLVLLRYVNPPTTVVQLQRRIEALVAGRPYDKRETFVPIRRISPELRRAVVAAEDTRFYQHAGIDWQEIQIVATKSQRDGDIPRGASTIPQQLVKNLFFTTHRNPVRKAFEFTLAPAAVLILGRERILELYLNVVEWGPGVFGAEAAAQYHYRTSAAHLDPEQAARLAAILPAPRTHKPSQMDGYSAIILARMALLARR